MTAPARSKTAAAGAKAPEREQSPKQAPKQGRAARNRSAAAERAYARRDERRERSLREPPERRPGKQRQTTQQPRTAVRPKARQLQARVAQARVPFVVAMMGVLGGGLVATLWLSITTVSGSYELQRAEGEVNGLNEQREQLVRQVSSLDSTPALERRAGQLGLVAAPEPAHLVRNPDGSTAVIGDPQQAVAPKPPPAPPAPTPQAPVPGTTPPAPPAPAGQPGAAVPADQAAARVPQVPQRPDAAVEHP